MKFESGGTIGRSGLLRCLNKHPDLHTPENSVPWSNPIFPKELGLAPDGPTGGSQSAVCATTL